MTRTHVLTAVLAAALLHPACVDGPPDTSPRDLYEEHVDLDDAAAVGLFEACPGDDFGPLMLRWLDQPQADTIVVRFEFSRNLSGAKGFAYAACLQDYLKGQGLAEFETDTDHPSYGTSTAGTTG